MSTIGLAFTPGDAVIVTGAGSGIGRAVANRAAQAGLAVAAWDVAAGPLDTVVDEIRTAGGTAVGAVADVTDDRAVTAALTRAADLGPLRHLVNNAGPASDAGGPFERTLTDAVGSVRRVTEQWLELAPPDDVSVVNIASVAGNRIGTASDWYCAAKAAIAGYTRHLAANRADRVRANAVAPGMVDTPRLAGFAASDAGRRVLDRIPAGRMGTPNEIAWPVLFLLSPLASYVNGSLVIVDGGWMVSQ